MLGDFKQFLLVQTKGIAHVLSYKLSVFGYLLDNTLGRKKDFCERRDEA